MLTAAGVRRQEVAIGARVGVRRGSERGAERREEAGVALAATGDADLLVPRAGRAASAAADRAGDAVRGCPVARPDVAHRRGVAVTAAAEGRPVAAHRRGAAALVAGREARAGTATSAPGTARAPGAALALLIRHAAAVVPVGDRRGMDVLTAEAV